MASLCSDVVDMGLEPQLSADLQGRLYAKVQELLKEQQQSQKLRLDYILHMEMKILIKDQQMQLRKLDLMAAQEIAMLMKKQAPAPAPAPATALKPVATDGKGRRV